MIVYFIFVLFQFLFLLCCGCAVFPVGPKGMVGSKCQMETHHPPIFSYDDSPTGPDNWPVLFETCGGDEQSPIDIDMSDLTTKKAVPLQWSAAYFNTPKSMTLTNDNHTVVLTASFAGDCKPKISGGCLKKPYFFSSLNFHWDLRDTKGSEHTLDDFSYPMEMHVIHSSYTRDAKILTDHVVLAYLFQVYFHTHLSLHFVEGIRTIGISKNKCKAMDRILNVFVKALKHPHKPIKLKRSFPLATLVRPFSSEYATYKGSITIPPCTEGVRWIVYPYPLDISKKQMEKFRLVCKYAPALVNNHRPVQPIHDRTVLFIT